MLVKNENRFGEIEKRIKLFVDFVLLQKRVFKEYPSEYLRRESGEPKGGSLKTLAAAAKEFLKLVYSVNKYRLGGK